MIPDEEIERIREVLVTFNTVAKAPFVGRLERLLAERELLVAEHEAAKRYIDSTLEYGCGQEHGDAFSAAEAFK